VPGVVGEGLAALSVAVESGKVKSKKLRNAPSQKTKSPRRVERRKKLVMIDKVTRSVRRDGVGPTALKCMQWPGRKMAQLRHRFLQWRLKKTKNHKTAFDLIYRLNTWDSKESVSGPGSTFAYTLNLRQRLPQLFEEHGIRTVFDAPCGDFNWMPHVLALTSVSYLGADIVRPLIANHQKTFTNERTEFRLLDITRDALPQVDLWICRDCLFHLSYQQIFEALSNFARSGIRFALLTNHRNEGGFENSDIRPGGFRKLDLFASPFLLPKDVLRRIQEGSGEETDHEMCLWTREQIAASLPDFGRRVGEQADGKRHEVSDQRPEVNRSAASRNAMKTG